MMTPSYHLLRALLQHRRSKQAVLACRSRHHALPKLLTQSGSGRMLSLSKVFISRWTLCNLTGAQPVAALIGTSRLASSGVENDDTDRSPFLKHSLKDGTLKRKLQNSAGSTVPPVFGVVSGLYQDTDHVEMLGLLGYDFLWADAEHSSATPSDVARWILAAERRGMPTLARIGYGYQDIIGHAQKYLVAGAQGIILPQCESREDVERVVDAVKFPPIGKRGLAGDRWNAWALPGSDSSSLAQRIEECNQNSIVGIVVESQNGIQNLGEMLQVDELDFVFLAPTDLSADLGLHGQIRHPKVLELIEKAGKQVQDAGKAAGMLTLSPEDYDYWRQRGFSILCCVAQNLFLDGARTMIEEIKKKEDGN